MPSVHETDLSEEWYCLSCLAEGVVHFAPEETAPDISDRLDEQHALQSEHCPRPRIVVGQRCPYPD